MSEAEYKTESTETGEAREASLLSHVFMWSAPATEPEQTDKRPVQPETEKTL